MATDTDPTVQYSAINYNLCNEKNADSNLELGEEQPNHGMIRN